MRLEIPGEGDRGNQKEEKEKNDGTTGKENDIEILKVTQGTGQIIKHKKRKKGSTRGEHDCKWRNAH